MVQVDVRNSGSRAGDEVVQMYVRDDVASVTRPVRELRGFERITLEPGQRRTVSFTLRPEHLAFYDQRMQRVVEPGFFTVWVGTSSADEARPARFEVAGAVQAVGPSAR
jgi:beta-glucosidase